MKRSVIISFNMLMKDRQFLFWFVFMLCGCSAASEVPKTLWGSSTRALENARVDAISATYQCEFDDCFDAILNLAEPQEGDEEPEVEKLSTAPRLSDYSREDEEVEVKTAPSMPFRVFMKDRIKSHIVVMGVPGNVDTTEVGIFFSRYSEDYITIEVSSLSRSAKRTVAEAIFKELDPQFQRK